jgi:hypothetical protein
MSEVRQPMLRDPEFLRIMAQNLEFRRIAALMQWETLLLFPMPLVVEGPALCPTGVDVSLFKATSTNSPMLQM